MPDKSVLPLPVKNSIGKKPQPDKVLKFKGWLAKNPEFKKSNIKELKNKYQELEDFLKSGYL